MKDLPTKGTIVQAIVRLERSSKECEMLSKAPGIPAVQRLNFLEKAIAFLKLRNQHYAILYSLDINEEVFT